MTISAVRASQDLIQSEQISQVVTAPTPKSQDLIQSEQNSPVVTAPTPESTSTVKCENSVCPLVTDVKSSTSNETIIVEYETAINSIASEISTSEVDKKLLTPEEQVQHAKGLIEEKRKIKEEEEKEVSNINFFALHHTTDRGTIKRNKQCIFFKPNIYFIKL